MKIESPLQVIEAENLTTEADVEAKVLLPLLSSPHYLNIPANAIRSKEYLSPRQIDKVGGKGSGYYPDFSIWIDALPPMIVEAKSPSVSAETGYREASLYARHLNQKYRSGLNPCQIILASNGVHILVGHWDSDPALCLEVSELGLGSEPVDRLVDFCGYQQLESKALEAIKELRASHSSMAYNRAGGQSLLNSKRPFNSFAAELAPLLRKYFTSSSQNQDPAIYEKAYVASNDVSTYDAVLDSLLKDRISRRRGSLTQDLEPTKRSEPALAKAISEYQNLDRREGQLQLITGSVGTGKSLFIRRYKELLQDSDQRAKSKWSIIDFNNAPNLSNNAEDWLCEQFIESFRSENSEFDIYENESLTKVFASELQKRRGVYAELQKVSEQEARLQRARDLADWQADPRKLAFGLCEHFGGHRDESVIVVMDNVDRLDLESQLAAFQLALWFMDKSKAFVILQMRDETYERFKDKPPLDTFKTGIVFHIRPPRFLDVVKRRMELALEDLSREADETMSYSLSSGMTISYPKSRLGEFMKGIYLELFERRHNVSRILQGIAGRNVRRALEMFVSILLSGHLREEAITSQGIGAGTIKVPEYVVLRILMRTEYRFFSNDSGFVSNIFHFDSNWRNPSNFLLPEILYWLTANRKERGELGLEGYFSVRKVAEIMELKGFPFDDVVKGAVWLLQKGLIEADHMNASDLSADDCVKLTASGFIHLRLLSERLEYIYGVLSVTPIIEASVTNRVADFINLENQNERISMSRMATCCEEFQRYLRQQYYLHTAAYPEFGGDHSGSLYVIEQLERALRFAREGQAGPAEKNLLDL